MDRGFYPALFILGIFHWIIFLNGGHLDFEVYDWQQEFYYLSSLKLALLEAKIPWRILPIYPKAPEFMGNPEICWAPQILLLRWMHPGTFVVFNACLLYSIGFVGCMALGRSLSLSRSSFAVLWLLLSFNGHITAHMARGHHMWLGYYYLPWLLWAFWKWTQNHNDPKLIRYLALIFFGMILQGSFHLAFGSMLFFVFLGMSRRKWWRGSAVVLVLTVLLSAIRFLPALDTLGLRQTDYRGGYLNIKTLLSGFTMLLQLDESKPTGVIVRANWHEYDVFIGWTGFAILALGLWSICISFLEPRKRDFRFFSVPIILLVIMSWGDVWKPFFELPYIRGREVFYKTDHFASSSTSYSRGL